MNKIKIAITGQILLLLILTAMIVHKSTNSTTITSNTGITENNSSTNCDTTSTETPKEYIKWVDFNVSSEALSTAYEYDVASHSSDIQLNWIELLAYAGCKCGGEFNDKAIKEINTVAKALQSGESTMEDISKNLKNYSYYFEVYSAVLDGYVGEYEIEEPDGSDSGEKVWVKKYGLKAFSPIAKWFPYNDYNDFGVSRSYGYKRNHLGHDMMGQVGTPIICVESGYIEALGWNQYGGWRIGIRSLDKKRYYYYAHLRQNFPYNKFLKEGDFVTAGDVIGYMGHTGYSATENVNNIDTTHLHFGLELIFDESQKDSDNEIWIDCYALTDFLAKQRSETVKDEESKEWSRVYDMNDLSTDEVFE